MKRITRFNFCITGTPGRLKAFVNKSGINVHEGWMDESWKNHPHLVIEGHNDSSTYHWTGYRTCPFNSTPYDLRVHFNEALQICEHLISPYKIGEQIITVYKLLDLPKDTILDIKQMEFGKGKVIITNTGEHYFSSCSKIYQEIIKNIPVDYSLKYFMNKK